MLTSRPHYLTRDWAVACDYSGGCAMRFFQTADTLPRDSLNSQGWVQAPGNPYTARWFCAQHAHEMKISQE